MRMSRFHAPTLREAPKEAQLPSHRLLLRAGYLRPLGPGGFALLPLGIATLSKIEGVVRREMSRMGALELSLPMPPPSEPEGDRSVTPTAEERVIDLVRRDVRSYRELPLRLFQLAARADAGSRAGGGLLRARGGPLCDGYTFDADAEAARTTFDELVSASQAVARRCGLVTRAVRRDQDGTFELHAPAADGDVELCACDQCGYTERTERAEIGTPAVVERQPTCQRYERVDTPGKRTVADVTEFLSLPSEALLKTLLVEADGRTYAALVRGDRELSLAKVAQALGASAVALADDATVMALTHAPVGFAGPIGLEATVPIVVDHEVASAVDVVVGANAADAHFRGVAVGRDFVPSAVADLRAAVDGDRCPRCPGALRALRGVEVATARVLGSELSDQMGCTFLDREGRHRPMVVGRHELSATRLMAALVEQHHDDRGIRWPPALAPFHVAVLPLGKGDDVVAAAEEQYRALNGLPTIDALLDDRKERAGVKFHDSDLMGFPYKLVLGSRGLRRGVAELKARTSEESEEIPLGEVPAVLAERLAAEEPT